MSSILLKGSSANKCLGPPENHKVFRWKRKNKRAFFHLEKMCLSDFVTLNLPKTWLIIALFPVEGCPHGYGATKLYFTWLTLVQSLVDNCWARCQLLVCKIALQTITFGQVHGRLIWLAWAGLGDIWCKTSWSCWKGAEVESCTERNNQREA